MNQFRGVALQIQHPARAFGFPRVIGSAKGLELSHNVEEMSIWRHKKLMKENCCSTTLSCCFWSSTVLESQPIPVFLYSNFGMGLLGQALANRAAVGSPELLKVEITGPLVI